MIKLIDDWKSAWKKASVIVSGVGVAGVAAWIATPDDQKAAILSFIGINPAWIPLIGFLGVIIARVSAKKDPE